MTNKKLSLIIPIVLALMMLFPTMPAGASARTAQSSSRQAHHASLVVKPRCISVGKHRHRVRIVLTHGVRGARYSFALVPLTQHHGFTWPDMGKYKANQSGVIRFHYRAPTSKRAAGPWQVTATRRLNRRMFKLAAVTQFKVKFGRCKRG